MADFRKNWSYTNESGVPVTEPVSVQNKDWARSAPVERIKDPNARTGGVQPRTNGWLDEIPFGSEHNFSFRRLSLLLSELEGRGVMGWSAITDYIPPALVWGSNGVLYTALLASGPSSTPRDPISEPAYWVPFGVIPSQAGEILAVATETAPTGTLLCNGAVYNSIDYPNLYAAIGNIYGGVLPTTFAVPDYRGYFLRGAGGSANSVDPGSDVTITGEILTTNLNVIGNVSDFTNLEKGAVLTAVSGVGLIAVGSKISLIGSDPNWYTLYQEVNQGPYYIIMDTDATIPGTVTLTFSNRQDRGDGTAGDAVGTIQASGIGKHQHSLIYGYKEIGESLNQTAAQWPLHGSEPLPVLNMDPFGIEPNGTMNYFQGGAETKAVNRSVLYCIKY